LSLVVVDVGSGLGNGLIMPAGPLRAPLEAQMARTGALIVIGDGGKAASLIKAFENHAKPVLKARMVPRQDRRWLGVLPVIGFAGIARPEKFFATLRDNGARLIDARSYPDHYRYSERQARSLLKEAKDYNAMLVTTEKDFVRLPDGEDSALGELKHRCRPFLIAVEFEDEDAVKELLASCLTQPRQDGSRGSV
jgi:tetraacyldisaccharide 4'-kinase